MVLALPLVVLELLLADSVVPSLPPALVAVDVDPVSEALAEEVVAEELPLVLAAEAFVVVPDAVEPSTEFDTPPAPAFVVLVPPAPVSLSVAESSDEQLATSVAPTHRPSLRAQDRFMPNRPGFENHSTPRH